MTETGNNSIAEFGVLQKKKISHQPLQKLSAAITRPSKRKRVTISSILPIGKEAQAAFDALDIDSTDEVYYPEGWIPSNHALDEHNGAIKFSWKGSPMNIEGQAYYDHLHPAEIMMASSLRLSPVQYLKCKRTLIMAAKKLQEQRVPFTKSVAQRLCRVDVNKTSALWTIFGQLGWFN
ncbi:hypothetical protein BDF20DRAFT_816982 [Mycotypha africana]|uniref:uncharacterized protein n=1 Tax=Mycotypha africana TaxID=64632 RepID=UPI0023019A75|nr:uncharacterized protein BDF20DRAFT_816982 [Mycotypha africana]KAI8984770.1 hypothetical protein BDF20DRAFT_816982 [Mycotypha africana]